MAFGPFYRDMVRVSLWALFLAFEPFIYLFIPGSLCLRTRVYGFRAFHYFNSGSYAFGLEPLWLSSLYLFIDTRLLMSSDSSLWLSSLLI